MKAPRSAVSSSRRERYISALSVKMVKIDVVLVQLPVLGRLDGGQQVADAADAQQAELARPCAWSTPRPREELLARRLVEEPQDAHAVLVVDGGHGVGVADVVDPGHVLVADALDAVVAEAVHEQGRALQGLGGDDLQRRGSCVLR